MERLTLAPNDGRDAGLRGYCSEQDAINRLAAYEDTGLEPDKIEIANKVIVSAFNLAANSGADMLIERLKEIIRAEAEGRLLVPPCKVGDTVYLRDLTPCKVVGINIGYYTRTVTIEFNDGGRIPNWQPRGFDEFGVSVFTTREAAEAALKERECDG